MYFQSGHQSYLKRLRNSSDMDVVPVGDVMQHMKSKLLNATNNFAPWKNSWSKKLSNMMANKFTGAPPANNSHLVKQTGAVHMPCSGLTKDAQSAIQRARSPECKQKLVDISCQHAQKYMFAKSLPRYCPLKGMFV